MSLLPTPPPTDEEFLDNVCLVDGGLFPAMELIKDILESQVKAKTAALNVAKGWTDTINEIKVPRLPFHVTPGKVQDGFVDAVIIAPPPVEQIITASESPGRLENTTRIGIYSLGERQESKGQVRQAHMRLVVLRGILQHYLTGYANADGLYIWKQLLPKGVSQLPEPYSLYSGLVAWYELYQPPGENYWGDL